MKAQEASTELASVVPASRRLQDDLTRTEAIGACIASASGSLPLHLMSFMVALAVVDDLLPVERAGWIGSCFMLGILASTIGLPMLGFRRVLNPWPIVAIGAAIAALWVGSLFGPLSLLTSWVVVGAACGLLHFLGSTTAGSYPDRQFVFGVRLAAGLLAAATVIGAGGLLSGFNSYGVGTVVLAGSFALIAVAGMTWYRAPPPRESRPEVGAALSSFPSGLWVGLGIVALFIAGQTGFGGYAVHGALANGIPAGDLPGVYAAAKALTAMVLLRFYADARSGQRSLLGAAMLGGAVILMAAATELVVFALGLVLWEIAMNAQSTRLQAMMVTRFPLSGSLWIPAAIASGAAIGPAIHGVLLAHAAGGWFVVLSVVSGFVPVAWAWFGPTARRF